MDYTAEIQNMKNVINNCRTSMPKLISFLELTFFDPNDWKESQDYILDNGDIMQVDYDGGCGLICATFTDTSISKTYENRHKDDGSFNYHWNRTFAEGNLDDFILYWEDLSTEDLRTLSIFAILNVLSGKMTIDMEFKLEDRKTKEIMDRAQLKHQDNQVKIGEQRNHIETVKAWVQASAHAMEKQDKGYQLGKF